ncbi:MAG TPA: hypothetical protein VMP68_01875 [Candidatus Eisenbacteria bacterium]|nr:hypothetical protein [Candidatus Eisenbacteria bacterium]
MGQIEMEQKAMGQIAMEQQVSSQQASLRRVDRAYRTAGNQVNRGGHRHSTKAISQTTKPAIQHS